MTHQNLAERVRRGDRRVGGLAEEVSEIFVVFHTRYKPPEAPAFTTIGRKGPRDRSRTSLREEGRRIASVGSGRVLGRVPEAVVRIAMVTVGTRGDAQPIVALGAELTRRGHEVNVGVPPNLVAFARGVGLAAGSVGSDSQAFMESAEGQQLLASGDAKELMNRLQSIAHDEAAQRNAEMRDLCDGADVIVSGPLTEHRASSLAERARVPQVLVHTCPIRPTGAVANPLVTTMELSPSQNRETHEVFDRMWWQAVEADVNAQRADLGLAPTSQSTAARVEERGDVEIQAYSSVLVPGLDWGDARPVVGFVHLCAEDRRKLGESEVDAGLDAWLSEGPPPAYFGFGSMPVTKPVETLAMISTVTADLGLRALVSAGWSGMAGGDREETRVRVVGMVNHDAVLPRCSLAVHHGGAGTTAASLRAGLPTLVCSVFADQPFWGTQVERLGVGSHVRFAELTERALGDGLGRIMAPDVRGQVRRVAARLQAETDATARTADIIESR